MNLILKELLNTKAHVGHKKCNLETSPYLLGRRASHPLNKTSLIPQNKDQKSGVVISEKARQHSEKPKTTGHSMEIEKKLRITFRKKRALFNIFNLEMTLFCLSQVIDFLQNLITLKTSLKTSKTTLSSSPRRPHILIMAGRGKTPSGHFHLDIAKILSKWNTLGNPQAQPSSKTSLQKPILSFVQEKWVGGMLTNWKQVSESLKIYSKFKYKFEDFLEKHKLRFPLYEKYNKRYLGLKEISTSLPDVIIITHPEDNDILIQEAFILKIPIIAFVNSDLPKNLLHSIQYPIPGNNASPYFIYFCLNMLLMALSTKK
uniref:Ribosomal protein S2 n=1 Tax=Monomastix sp. (strain OKE-1) TaxID=141716 RepID=U5YGH6_MONSK|nr:ribosomal protein S2 [Monomastix sp. OKE-1]AGZ90225.1 ribosomal protein S2 [Monomastix sp. OKE-1]